MISYKKQLCGYCKTRLILPIFLFLVAGIIQKGYSFQENNEKYTISGYVKESGSGELLPGVSIYITALKKGVVTNDFGFYSLTLPLGTYDVNYSYIGFKTVTTTISLTQNIQKDIDLTIESNLLDEVIIDSRKNERISSKVQMSTLSLPVEQIQDIPALLGEKDVLKVFQLMPGVSAGSEGSSGLYVRGGGPDQNLFILDDATVYNANHLFGFLSVFNGDAIKSVEMYKGGFPARYGGRLSSVLDIRMLDGNKNELHGKFGIGLLSSNITLQGPIKKGKTSFLFSGRRTYLDLFTRLASTSESKVSPYFYDLNAKINHEFDSKNKLYISSYMGRDIFKLKENYDNEKYKTRLGWGNQTATIRWNHQFNDKLFSNTSLIYSNFKFFLDVEEEYSNQQYDAKFHSGITDLGVKLDFDYFPSLNHHLRFGAQALHHNFTPHTSVIKEKGFPDNRSKTEFRSIESAVYVEDEWKISERFKTNLGIRVSSFNYKSLNYINPESRVSLAYKLNDVSAVKASYSSMNQYIHLLSNSGIGLPTDLWVSSTDRVKPQSSHQVALGYSRDFIDENFTLSLEGYYKKSNNVIGYKEGTDFIFDAREDSEKTWEDNVVSGEAEAYGLEFLLQRKFGKFTGWIGYTLAWSDRQFDELNQGKRFFARYDRRHDVSLVGIYKPSKKITLSGSWIYASGSNYTLPNGEIKTPINDRHDLSQSNIFNNRGISKNYEERNNFRGESTHRLDLSIQFHKKKKRGTRTWDFSIYNAYFRKNPFTYIFKRKNGVRELNRISILPIIPSITYKYEF
ncbi:TonB-dependent receptor [Aquimarina sp. TRL1]|uniref:TonB-dependent receptor n=1 Tax=Aquimarina sp. (strain TRL1) TaxID=2736252 RepID=UPI001589DAF0|nr:TonB-dependent receptor [Aquimarina sp. TRL1]QKX06012.1 TonB-dependent receptor [Aquimarina sp. TRL1]